MLIHDPGGYGPNPTILQLPEANRRFTAPQANAFPGRVAGIA
jgi:hypothetical protein